MTKYLAVLALIMLIGAASSTSVRTVTYEVMPLAPDYANAEIILTTLASNGKLDLHVVSDTLTNLGYHTLGVGSTNSSELAFVYIVLQPDYYNVIVEANSTHLYWEVCPP